VLLNYLALFARMSRCAAYRAAGAATLARGVRLARGAVAHDDHELSGL
jgi:hypothetical protein